MRTTLLTVALMAGLMVPVWAGSPTEINTDIYGGIGEVTIGQTDSLAAAGIDTTVAMDGGWVHWYITGSGTALGSGSSTLNDGAAGDSVGIVLQTSVDGTVWTESVASFVLTGQAAAEQEPTVFGRWMRWIITNNDENAHPYTVRIQFPAR